MGRARGRVGRGPSRRREGARPLGVPGLGHGDARGARPAGRRGRRVVLDLELVVGASITGLGSALPDRVVTNEELAQRLGVSAAWIFERTGIESRWIAGGSESTSSLATE